MEKKQNKKIYSIENSSNVSNLIEIETVILNGLYRFSILGVGQKNSSEIKDRVYSALRSQKLLNLKSDNKKITVNLLPTNINKKDNFYDLSIALSCMIHTNQLFLDEDVLAIGELSILGNIIPSKYLLKAIYQAIQNNIKIIICSNKDLEKFYNHNHTIHDLIQINKINFISADTLAELVLNIKNKEYFIYTDKNKLLTNENKTNNAENIKLNDKNIFKIILAICTNRNIFIENKKGLYIQKFIKNLIYYNSKINNKNILQISNMLDQNDDEVLNEYQQPIVSFIDKQTPKDQLDNLMKKSTFGFNVVSDFANLNEEILHIIKTNSYSSVLCFYDTCPCGNNNLFFNNFNQDRCLCLQRHIIKYRQKIKRLENNFFDFYINNTLDINLEYDSYDYININNLINNFKEEQVSVLESTNIFDLIGPEHNNYDKQEIENILALSKDIVKLEYILNKNTLTLSKASVQLAIDFLKKDF
jgi:hypothetical protein